MLTDYRLFFREFVSNFHSTGSLAPSSRWLARALVRYVPPQGPRRAVEFRRILEVGPGTGAVTRQLVSALGPTDRLDLVELNAAFVERLERRFALERPFTDVAERTRIWRRSVEEVEAEQGYDAIVSGLPFNNFEPELVRRLLSMMTGLLAPGGTLSFFQYVGVRPVKKLASRGAKRQRLVGIGRAIDEVLGPGEFRRECVVLNAPPAWVHHVRPHGVAANDDASA